MSDYCENGKPKDCRYCYYYGRHGCMLKVCYYDRPKPETKPVSECDDCPYVKCGPWRPGDVGLILRTFNIKKNVEVTDNGKDNF